MSKINWSSEQKTAIETTDTNIVVSAGAGSGKTAVLSERVYQQVKSGSSISSFLVLTFTNAAASEMKSRIRDKILKDPQLKHLAAEIENAHIETFDAFALFIVKKYAFQLNVPRDISVIDNTILTTKTEKIINDIFNEKYKAKDDNFINFINKYCIKDDDFLRTAIKSIYKYIGKLIDKNDFLNNIVEYQCDLATIEKMIQEEFKSARNKLQFAYSLADQLDPIDSGNVQAYIESLLQIKDYDELRNAIYFNGAFPRKPSKCTSSDNLRDEIKKLVNCYSKDFDPGSKKDIIDNIISKKEDVALLISYVKELDARLEEIKKKYKSYTFDDIAKLALKAMRMEEINKGMRQTFKNILVDEYQDTSDVQEEVINLLSDNNAYMVGDVKQSIYRFRNANCEIFQNKYEKYSNNDGGIKIDLNANYRSRKEIVDLINDLYSYLMNPKTNLIDYSKGHKFKFGNTTYSNYVDNSENYGLKILEYNYEHSYQTPQKEINLILDDIINKINNKYQVFDSSLNDNNGGLRDCTFKDFAILIDRSATFEKYRQEFGKKNVPIRVVDNEKVKDSDISYVTKNLLRMFKNIKANVINEEFVHSFLSISRSFLVSMSDQDIYTIVKTNNFNLTNTYKKVKNVVDNFSDSSTYEILDALFDEFELYDKIITLGNYSSNAHIAEIFLNLVKDMDKLGFSIDEVVSYFDEINEYNLEIDFTDNQSVDNSVTLMTMHKSKGLEFPFVYLAGLIKEFNHSDTKSKVIVNSEYGVILPPTGDFEFNNLSTHLYKEKYIQADYEERLRLLYVAMTRAKERLILVVGAKENEKEIYDITNVNSFASLMKATPFYNKYKINIPYGNSQLMFKWLQIPPKNIEFKEICVNPGDVISKNKASKQVSEGVDQSLLDFGNRIHQLLEVVNIETKDISYIKNKNEQKYICNVINSSIFEGVKNDQVRHEFKFFDNVNNLNGVIDALIIKDNEIDIVDFKLKNLDDEAYVKQLYSYKDYISTISTKKIKLYLIAALTGEVKEIG